MPSPFFPSFSLPVFSPLVTLLPCFSTARAQGWSCGDLPGLAALCLVSRRSAYSLCQCRCECKLVCPGESLSSRVMGWAPIVERACRLALSHGGCGAPVPVVPLPIRSRHRGTTVSSVIDTAPRGQGRVVAYSALPEGSSQGLVSGKTLSGFLGTLIMIRFPLPSLAAHRRPSPSSAPMLMYAA